LREGRPEDILLQSVKSGNTLRLRNSVVLTRVNYKLWSGPFMNKV
jgi:hypothetical protein